MKLDVRERALTVAMAEAACLQAHIARLDATTAIKREFTRVATPLRVVSVGLGAGFVAGMRPARPKADKTGPVGALLSMTLEAVLPGIMAGLTAGQAAADEVEEQADDVAEKVADQLVDEVEDAAASAAAAETGDGPTGR